MIHLAADGVGTPKFGLSEAEIKKAYANARPGAMDPVIYRHTRNVLHAGVDRVYGTPKYNEPDFAKAYHLKQNLSQFTAFKTAEQTARLAAAEELDDAHILNRRYNVNYLRTEYVHSVRGSRAAKNWDRIQRDKDLYGSLRYEASTAGEPRKAHKRLYGIVRPVDDDFWRVWFPPNDWGCKCGTSQVRGEKSSSMPRGVKPPPPVMRNNPGITGKLIPYTHPIIQRAKNRKARREKGEKLERRIVRENVRAYAKKMYEDNTFILDGNAVKIPNRGIKKSLSQKHNRYDLKNVLLLQLPEVMKNAKYHTQLPPKPENTIVEATYFYSFELDGKTNYLVVWKYKSGEMALHSVVDEIRKAL